MKDAENLSKLVRNLRPQVCKSWIETEFGVLLPEVAEDARKTEVRAVFTTALEALTSQQRASIESVAEDICLLCDAAGIDALDACTWEDDEAGLAAFQAQESQFARSLWLYRNKPSYFKEALAARKADQFRQSAACFSGFAAPENLKFHETQQALDAFRAVLAKQFGRKIEDVAVEFFERHRPEMQGGAGALLYQVCIHYNALPEAAVVVKDSAVAQQQIVRAHLAYITYEPNNGHLEVLSKDKEGREALALAFAQNLLQTQFDGQKIPIKQYDYERLAKPYELDVSNEASVCSAKLVEVTVAGDFRRKLQFKLGYGDTFDIHEAARSMLGSDFRFSDHALHGAKIAVRIKNGRSRVRTVNIVLSGSNGCNIKSKCETDRALCDRLLYKWKLVKDITATDEASLSAQGSNEDKYRKVA